MGQTFSHHICHWPKFVLVRANISKSALIWVWYKKFQIKVSIWKVSPNLIYRFIIRSFVLFFFFLIIGSQN